MLSTPRDLDDLRRLMALKTSESETGAKDKNSGDDNDDDDDDDNNNNA
jgi:hypothetical protein